MKTFEQLTGYNENIFVKNDHVFIENVGTFYKTKQIAKERNLKTGNEVGLYIESYIHEGVIVYRELQQNLFD